MSKKTYMVVLDRCEGRPEPLQRFADVEKAIYAYKSLRKKAEYGDRVRLYLMIDGDKIVLKENYGKEAKVWTF